jgi:hypothetical protein
MADRTRLAAPSFQAGPVTLVPPPCIFLKIFQHFSQTAVNGALQAIGEFETFGGFSVVGDF